MSDQVSGDTIRTSVMEPVSLSGNMQQDVLMHVYRQLEAKGYDPITQLVGYMITGEPTYITSFGNARTIICRMERYEIMEEIIRFYVENHIGQGGK